MQLIIFFPPQISRLRITWSALKQTHASSYDLYETKLSSFSRSLNDASGALPLQKIVIPHLFPLVELLERSVNGSEILSFPWELNSPTFGLDTLLIHLDTARVITERPNLYRAVAERIILETELERCLLDLLCPQTHMKYIWGSRGVKACRDERLNKSEQLVNLLSEKVEPSWTDLKRVPNVCILNLRCNQILVVLFWNLQVCRVIWYR